MKNLLMAISLLGGIYLFPSQTLNATGLGKEADFEDQISVVKPTVPKADEEGFFFQ